MNDEQRMAIVRLTGCIRGVAIIADCGLAPCKETLTGLLNCSNELLLAFGMSHIIEPVETTLKLEARK